MAGECVSSGLLLVEIVGFSRGISALKHTDFVIQTRMIDIVVERKTAKSASTAIGVPNVMNNTI